MVITFAEIVITFAETVIAFAETVIAFGEIVIASRRYRCGLRWRSPARCSSI
jgi:hypothetical protein